MEPWHWLLAVGVPALVGAVWLLFRAKVERTEARLDEHITEDVKVHERTAVLESRADRTENDIGDHDKGIRGTLHEHAQTLTHHEVRITMLEKK